MAVRLQQHLERSIAEAADPVAAACLQAELAVLRARLGYADEAQALVEQIGALQARDPRPTLSAWLALARALVGYCGDRNEPAYQPLARAMAMAAAARVRPVQALAAAWLSHMHYLGNDAVLMARYAAQALQEAEPEHHSARSRACLVVAQSYHYAGDLPTAQCWYRRAHEHATAEGDGATLAALLHNRAGIDSNNARLQRLYGAEARPAMLMPLRETLAALESAQHLNDHLRIGNEDPMVPMLKALLMVISDQPEVALALYRQHFDAGLRDGMQHYAGALLAERAWCQLRLGRLDEAEADATLALAALSDETRLDDNEEVAATLAWVALLRRHQGREAEAEGLLVRGRERLQRYQQLRQSVREQFDLALARVEMPVR